MGMVQSLSMVHSLGMELLDILDMMVSDMVLLLGIKSLDILGMAH